MQIRRIGSHGLRECIMKQDTAYHIVRVWHGVP